MLTHWLDEGVEAFTRLFPDYSFFNLGTNVRGFLAVVLVSLICGAVGSLVVGNRMAFFSDALAHCAFAGVALGFLLALAFKAGTEEEFNNWIIAVMIVFGILVGVGIAYVKEKTALANDTVIGVFFAGAIGFGALLLKSISRRRYFNPENFLFGDVTSVSSFDLLVLLALGLATAALLFWLYNRLIFTTFNPSLARSRLVPVRLCNYLFIVLLALIVNLCLKTVGALLINALLIVPAATAGNVSRNMRQLFWYTIGICLLVGVLGQWLSWSITLHDQDGELHLGTGGTIVVLSVVCFFFSMLATRYVRGRQTV